MKKCLSYFILMISFLLLFTGIRSQQKEIPPAADRAGKLTGWMKTNLQLTAEQEPKVQEINLKYANKADQLRTSSMSKMGKMKSLKADGKAKDEELKQVLTPDQYKTYEAKKAEIQKKFKEEMKKRKSEG